MKLFQTRAARFLFYLCFFLLLFPPNLVAQVKDDFKELTGLTIEELLQIKVVTASAKEEIIIKAPANIFVVTKEQIKERNYRTLTEIFPDLPGFVVTNQGPSKNVYYTIRGHFDNRRLKVMINGMDINPKSGENLIFGVSRFPVEMIEKIEFIIGPYASLYGRDSFSGVLNIITRKGESLDGVQGNLLYSGTYEHSQAEAVVGSKIGDFDLLISAYYNSSKTGRDLVEEYPDIYDFEKRQERRLAAGLSAIPEDTPKDFIMPWQSSNVFFRLEHDKGMFFDFDLNISKAPKVGAGFQSHLYYQNEDTYLRDKILNSRIGMSYNLGEFFVTTTLSLQNYSFEGLNGYLDNTDKWYLNKDNSIVFDNKFRYALSVNDELSGRITYEKLKSYLTVAGVREYNSAKPDWDEKDIVNDNFYNLSLQYSKDLSKQFSVLLGLTYENSDSKEAILLPRFSLLWHFSEHSNLKFLFGGGYLGVDPVSTADQIVSETNSIKGTTGLKPETLRSYEINFTHIDPEKYLLSFSVFYNLIDNIADIVPDTSLPAPFSRIYKNVGFRKAFGIDSYLKLQISKKIRIHMNYSYIDGYSEVDDVREDNLPVTAPHYFNIGINILALNDYLNIYIRNTYIDKFYTSSQTELNGYNCCSFSINTTSKLLNRFEVSLLVNNVFDKKGFDPAISPASYRSDIPIARRNWNVGLHYNIGF